ncbi:MAG: hypothetical protein V3S29_14870, partial [bacterium]
MSRASKFKAKFPPRAIVAALGITVAMVFALTAVTQQARAQGTIKIGVPLFLSGAAAGPFGVPARNGVVIIIAGINSGKIPAPYNT